MTSLILLALLTDLLVGDPRNFPHPVVIIGTLIHRCETIVRKFAGGPTGLRLGGILLVLGVVTITFMGTWILIRLAEMIHPYLGLIVHLWLLSTTLAVKSLSQHAMAVAEPLARGDLNTARSKVALIVGRDTDKLNERGIARATVETVAENTVDGIISPLFYAFIGGAPLAMVYKAINTMDSMIGHRDEKYLHLGWAAARLDDLANYLPARLAGFLYPWLAVFYPGGFFATVRAILRDAPKHPSPNSGIPEAAVAGALGIQLGGTNHYRGQVSHRSLMGEDKLPLSYGHIPQALRLTYGVTALVVAGGVILDSIFH
ncbi:adenosylcobinamide-phosphate synthase [Desulforamulus reducens MI-1]|uniref:Cobalamin biosynthesis protein CobD n=1 Tax=Desulforamulus reducens (strain ATCC BAA-1160 / DSM 100696 / MI-1) TaxID=349161 RepID=A4J805_DESRM|nr:adenosylcobinamide-phosphate synthase CbiB [Desulforamulus reducens]ABO51208.1 adenosylcobinamide-phosphate synthase [Desulforamulus reducens MI-1]